MKRASFGLIFALALAQHALAEDAVCGKTARDIYSAAGRSVVEIYTRSVNPLLVQGRVQAGSGTGFLIEGDYVVTNYHVVVGASRIVMFLGDNAERAEVVGIDPASDIAVLKPEYGSLFDGVPRLSFETAPPEMGAPVWAIGFPLGLGETISQGIVSGLNRVDTRHTVDWETPDIQIDASISPGNSGGPVLDDCGKVVGMSTKAINPQYGENLAFAIPAQAMAPIVAEIIRQGHVSRPWHGLYGKMLSEPIMSLLGIPYEQWGMVYGFLVETVEPGSAADRAGLRGGDFPVKLGGTEFLLGGDIITEVNGVRIESLDTALEVVRDLKIGDRVTLTYMRDGQAHSASVTLEERPLLPEELALYRHD